MTKQKSDLSRAFSEDGAIKPHVGGQALIEGVMMRGQYNWAVAVREPDGAIYAVSYTHLFEVDHLGLDAVDNRLLEVLCVQFGGRPVGLTTLASALAEDPDTVEDVYEPYLMQQGLMMRTPKGRQATAGAWEHLGLTPPEGC